MGFNQPGNAHLILFLMYDYWCLLENYSVELVLGQSWVLLNKTYPTDIKTIVNFKKLNLT